MKVWTSTLFDGRFHAVTGVDNNRFKIYFECGMVKHNTAPQNFATRTMLPMIDAKSPQHQVENFDLYCKRCMMPGAPTPFY